MLIMLIVEMLEKTNKFVNIVCGTQTLENIGNVFYISFCTVVNLNKGYQLAFLNYIFHIDFWG